MVKGETIVIRRPEARDRAEWDCLYAGYAAFYKVDQDQAMRDRVWSWLQDPDHEVEGLLAVDGANRPLGLTHFRPYARPLMAGTGCFLDDLFVAPEQRGSGAAEALIRAVEAEARQRGWGLVRWITADDNYRARGLYDRLAQRTMWVTYDRKVES